MNSEILTIIVNYKLKEDCADCIASLQRAGAELRQIIVVDNASKDGSVEYLQSKFGVELCLIENEYNRGYAAGLNTGIREALKRSHSLILLLNNDTIAAPDFLSELQRATQSGVSYDLFGPAIFYYDYPDRIWFLGGKLLPGTLISHTLLRNHKLPGHLPDLLPVDFINGCAMLVRREVFEKIGLLDESSLLYAEEVDFCWRARLSGLKLAAVPVARLFHKVSQSTRQTLGQQSLRAEYLRFRNQARFYARYAHGAQRSLMVIFSGARALMFALWDIFSGRPGLAYISLSGWWDGWR
jgi:GT2 family glycosyltransferase